MALFFHVLPSILMLASYVLASLLVYALAARYLVARGIGRITLFSICLCLGPVLLGWVLAVGMLIFPHSGNGFLLAWTAVPFLLAAYYARNEFSHIRMTLVEFGASYWAREPLTGVVVLCLLAFGIIGTLIALITPLHTNDALEYATVAGILFETKDILDYPIIDSGAFRGFYAPWTHPPGYVSLLVWGHIIQEIAGGGGATKIAGIYFTAATSLVIFCSARHAGKPLAFLAVVLYLSTPLVISQSLNASIDPVRVAALTSVLAIAAKLTSWDRASGIFLGVSVGLCLFTHSINLLVIPLLATVIAVRIPGWHLPAALKQLLHRLLIPIALSAVVVIGPFYFQNLAAIGSLAADSVPLWSVEELGYRDYFRYQRQILTNEERIVMGLFRGISRYGSFGTSYWILITALLGTLFFKLLSGRFLSEIREVMHRLQDNSLFYAAAVISVVFWILVLVTMLMGMDILIKNDRYLLTIHPFISIVSAYAVCSLLATSRPEKGKHALRPAREG